MVLPFSVGSWRRVEEFIEMLPLGYFLMLDVFTVLRAKHYS
jgi:hypothetical protein